MKTVWKLCLLALVLLLVAAPMTVFAANDKLTDDENTRTIDVEAKYCDGTEAPDVYSLDVTWGAMQFTYQTSGTKKWNPANHSYDGNVTGHWNAGSGTDGNNRITVVNHSNVAVNVVFAYEKAEGFDGIKGAFTVNSDRLEAGVEGMYDSADSVSTELTLSGTLSGNVTEFTKVGSITISLQ